MDAPNRLLFLPRTPVRIHKRSSQESPAQLQISKTLEQQTELRRPSQPSKRLKVVGSSSAEALSPESHTEGISDDEGTSETNNDAATILTERVNACRAVTSLDSVLAAKKLDIVEIKSGAFVQWIRLALNAALGCDLGVLNDTQAEALVTPIDTPSGRSTMRDCLRGLARLLQCRCFVLGAELGVKSYDPVTHFTVFSTDGSVTQSDDIESWQGVFNRDVSCVVLVTSASVSKNMGTLAATETSVKFAQVVDANTDAPLLRVECRSLQKVLVRLGYFEPTGMMDMTQVKAPDWRQSWRAFVCFGLSASGVSRADPDKIKKLKEVYKQVLQLGLYKLTYNPETRYFEVKITTKQAVYPGRKPVNFQADTLCVASIKMWDYFGERWFDHIDTEGAMEMDIDFAEEKRIGQEVQLLKSGDFFVCEYQTGGVAAANSDAATLVRFVAITNCFKRLAEKLPPETAKKMKERIHFFPSGNLLSCCAILGSRKEKVIRGADQDALVNTVWRLYKKGWETKVQLKAPSVKFEAAPRLQGPLPREEKALMISILNVANHSRNSTIFSVRQTNHGGQVCCAPTREELYEKVWASYGHVWQDWVSCKAHG